MTVVGAALSEHPLATHAVGETVGHLLDVGGPRPDLVALFATEAHLGVLEDIVGAVRQLLEPRALIGACTQSVLAGSREVEDHSALVIQAMWLGGTRIRPIRIDSVPGTEGTHLRGLGALDGATGTLVLLSDPFSFPAHVALGDLAVTAPGLSVVGGAASAARRPGGNRLLLDAAIVEHGAVALHLDDTVALATAVSQCARPVGQPFTVTAADAEGNPLVLRVALPELVPPINNSLKVHAVNPDGNLRFGDVVYVASADGGVALSCDAAVESRAARYIVSASSATATCQTWPLSSAGGLRRLRMR